MELTKIRCPSCKSQATKAKACSGYIVLPISYLDSSLHWNDVERGHHGKIYSKK